MAILINQSLPALTRRTCRCLTHSAAVCAASSEDKSDTSHMMELQNLYFFASAAFGVSTFATEGGGKWGK